MKSKKMWICMMMLVSSLVITACSKKEVVSKEPVYTNMADDMTQDEIKEVMVGAGVDKEIATEFITWVNDYNDSLISEKKPVAGYEALGQTPIDYSEFMTEEQYREDGSIVSGMNCRLTAFLLMNQWISTEEKLDDYDPYLMFDVECIELDEKFKSFDEEKFITLMQPVDVKPESSLEEHKEAIQNAWEERGIKIEDNGNVSLVTLYLHDNYENKRFVGHAAVMIKTKEGILLLEKYGWNEPFQATKLNNEEEMVDYLLNRTDLVGDGTEEPVIVMKNNTVIR